MTTVERHHTLEERLPAYVLGATEPAEAREIAEHLAECPSCRHELESWRRTAEELAATAPSLAPSPGVRERLVAAIEGERPSVDAAPRGAAEPARRSPAWLAAAALTCAALALGALAWGWTARGSLRSEVAGLEGEVARLERRLSATETELARSIVELRGTRAVLAVLATSPPSRDVVLAGLAPAPDGTGRLVVDPAGRRAVLLAGRLPPLPEGRVYQLWTLTDGAPASAGIFEPLPGGTAVHVIDELPAVGPDAWAVTIEPAGGVPQPTGEMVLLS